MLKKSLAKYFLYKFLYNIPIFFFPTQRHWRRENLLQFSIKYLWDNLPSFMRSTYMISCASQKLMSDANLLTCTLYTIRPPLRWNKINCWVIVTKRSVWENNVMPSKGKDFGIFFSFLALIITNQRKSRRRNNNIVKFLPFLKMIEKLMDV